MRILTEKRLTELLKRTYESGVNRGYELGYLMRHADRRNRGAILGYAVQKEVEKILEGEDNANTAGEKPGNKNNRGH